MSNSNLNNNPKDLKEVLRSLNFEEHGKAFLLNADSLVVLKELPDNSIDSAVIDGPYGIGLGNFNPKAIAKGIRRKGGAGISPSMFSGKYDKSRTGALKFQQFSYEWATELLRVLKPGAMLLSFCSSSMYHRMATGIEDAGFEIRDQIQWLCGQNHSYAPNIDILIDKHLGAKRKVVGPNPNRKGRRNWDNNPKNITLPATEEAKAFEGWGYRLRQTNEPIVLARKPLAEKSLTRNVLRYGTGAMNIEACKFGEQRRFPTNTILDGEVAEMLADKERFFYSARVTKKEKHAGCEPLKRRNHHSTVKPISLMEYLVKLVTPKNGTCIDIFMGAASTGIACVNLGFDFIGVEIEPEFFQIAKARINYWQLQRKAA